MLAARPENREERKKNSPLMCVTAKREGHGEYVVPILTAWPGKHKANHAPDRFATPRN